MRIFLTKTKRLHSFKIDGVHHSTFAKNIKYDFATKLKASTLIVDKYYDKIKIIETTMILN